MPYINFTEKPFGLQDLIITNIKVFDKLIKIFAKLEVKEQHCPCCGTTTRTIHDYRKQIIKDIPIAGRSVEIHFRKRRYRCPHCGKGFAEENSFLPRYYRVTNRLVEYVCDKLREVYSFASIARELNLTISRTPCDRGYRMFDNALLSLTATHEWLFIFAYLFLFRVYQEKCVSLFMKVGI